ncbi:MAG TPA: NUDIX domain-containing protein, partial [Chitinophagaceae bacterium]
FARHDDTVYIDELNTHTLKTIIHQMEQPKIHVGIFVHENLIELNTAFQKRFTLIQAAGGLVKNSESKVLMIFRRGKWDLPKGKLDKNEKLEDCALREVEEETGLKNIILNRPVTTTYHTYHEGTKHVLKESHWYAMTVSGLQTLTPQTEEDIFDIRWVEQDDIHSYLPQAFPLIKDIMESAKQTGFISF